MRGALLGSGIVALLGTLAVGSYLTRKHTHASDPEGGTLPFSVITGTVTDAQLASNYSGVGACGANTWASTLNDNAAPTCTQPGFSNISGLLALAQITDDAAASKCLLSGGAGDPAWNTCPGGGPDLSAEPFTTYAASAALSAERVWNNGTNTTVDIATAGQIKLNLSGTHADSFHADSYSGIGACGANTWASTLNDTAAPTCTQPAFSNLSGSASIAQGGTTETASAEDAVLVGSGVADWQPKTVPNCPESGTLNYDNTTNTFSCLTDSGAGGGVNSVEVSVALGTSGGLVFGPFTVTGQTWVTATSKITCAPFALVDDGQTIETYAAAALSAVVSNRVVSTGFDIHVFSPHGATGTYRFHCLGS